MKSSTTDSGSCLQYLKNNSLFLHQQTASCLRRSITPSGPMTLTLCLDRLVHALHWTRTHKKLVTICRTGTVCIVWKSQTPQTEIITKDTQVFCEHVQAKNTPKITTTELHTRSDAVATHLCRSLVEELPVAGEVHGVGGLRCLGGGGAGHRGIASRGMAVRVGRALALWHVVPRGRGPASQSSVKKSGTETTERLWQRNSGAGGWGWVSGFIESAWGVWA